MKTHALALPVALALILGLASPAAALNKQGIRSDDESADKDATFNVTGYLFTGLFLFNPTYASRPNNVGIALGRLGGHVDVDLYRRWLTLSYDANLFLDRGTVGFSEWDHILGLLTQIPLPRGFGVNLGAHFEYDGPLDAQGAGYSQTYVDAMARLTWESDHASAFLAVGGFLFNPTYAARPDNTGLALLRYQAHGELHPQSWLYLRLDLNCFSDRQESGAAVLRPSELDATVEVGARHGDLELRLVGEADLPLSSPTPSELPTASPHSGLKQVYISAIVQWSFDGRKLWRSIRRR